MTLAHQVALVTGAAQGIGKAAAQALAEAGATVVVADIAGDKAETAADEIRATQRRALGVQADVGDVADIDRVVRHVVEAYGQIDILVNNAGVTRRADIMDLTEADWDRIHRVNAKGVFFCLQRVARDDPAAQRTDHQHRLNCGEGVCGGVQRRLCREQGRGDRHDKAGGAAIGQAQYQRQRGLSGGDAHRAVGCQSGGKRAAGRR
jgi:NAD(P)-dependent dehydrogenase (short-subunit alcohol dehydrogenase family)